MADRATLPPNPGLTFGALYTQGNEAPTRIARSRSPSRDTASPVRSRRASVADAAAADQSTRLPAPRPSRVLLSSQLEQLVRATPANAGPEIAALKNENAVLHWQMAQHASEHADTVATMRQVWGAVNHASAMLQQHLAPQAPPIGAGLEPGFEPEFQPTAEPAPTTAPRDAAFDATGPDAEIGRLLERNRRLVRERDAAKLELTESAASARVAMDVKDGRIAELTAALARKTGEFDALAVENERLRNQLAALQRS